MTQNSFLFSPLCYLNKSAHALHRGLDSHLGRFTYLVIYAELTGIRHSVNQIAIAAYGGKNNMELRVL